MSITHQKLSVFRLLTTGALCLVLLTGSGCSSNTPPTKDNYPAGDIFTYELSDYPYFDPDVSENPGSADVPVGLHAPNAATPGGTPGTSHAPKSTKPRTLTAAEVYLFRYQLFNVALYV